MKRRADIFLGILLIVLALLVTGVGLLFWNYPDGMFALPAIMNLTSNENTVLIGKYLVWGGIIMVVVLALWFVPNPDLLGPYEEPPNLD